MRLNPALQHKARSYVDSPIQLHTLSAESHARGVRAHMIALFCPIPFESDYDLVHVDDIMSVPVSLKSVVLFFGEIVEGVSYERVEGVVDYYQTARAMAAAADVPQ